MVGAVIVTYDSADVIGSCLEGLFTVAPTAQVIVVDNASRDRPTLKVRVIANGLLGLFHHSPATRG